MCFPTLSVKRLDFSGWREVRLRSVTHAFSVIQMHKARFTNVCIDVCVAFENTQAGASVHAISKQFQSNFTTRETVLQMRTSTFE